MFEFILFDIRHLRYNNHFFIDYVLVFPNSKRILYFTEFKSVQMSSTDISSNHINVTMFDGFGINLTENGKGR